MNCLWAFLGLLPREAAGAMHSFMVLEDMMIDANRHSKESTIQP